MSSLNPHWPAQTPHFWVPWCREQGSPEWPSAWLLAEFGRELLAFCLSHPRRPGFGISRPHGREWEESAHGGYFPCLTCPPGVLHMRIFLSGVIRKYSLWFYRKHLQENGDLWNPLLGDFLRASSLHLGFSLLGIKLPPWVPQGFASLDPERVSFEITIRFATFNLNFPCTFGEVWSLNQWSWHHLGAC